MDAERRGRRGLGAPSGVEPLEGLPDAFPGIPPPIAASILNWVNLVLLNPFPGARFNRNFWLEFRLEKSLEVWL